MTTLCGSRVRCAVKCKTKDWPGIQPTHKKPALHQLFVEGVEGNHQLHLALVVDRHHVATFVVPLTEEASLKKIVKLTNVVR